jgi:hypothetical protein
VPAPRTDRFVIGHDPAETGPMTVTPTRPGPGLVAHHRSVLRPFRLTALDSAPCGLTLTDTHPALGRFAADREVGR